MKDTLELRFKQKFTCLGSNQGDQFEVKFQPYVTPDDVLEFISTELSRQKEELKVKIKKIEKENNGDWFLMGDEILSLL